MGGLRISALAAIVAAAFTAGFISAGGGRAFDRGSGGGHIERIHPQPEGLSWAGHFTRVVRSRGTLVHISPMGATDGAGNIVGGDDIEAQARRIYKKLAIALKAAGARPRDVVMHRSYVVGLSPEDGPKLARLMAEFYPPDARPAAALLGIDKLIDPALRLEIEVIAVIDD